MRRNFRAARVALWLNLLPKIQRAPVDPTQRVPCLYLLDSLDHNATSLDDLLDSPDLTSCHGVALLTPTPDSREIIQTVRRAFTGRTAVTGPTGHWTIVPRGVRSTTPAAVTTSARLPLPVSVATLQRRGVAQPADYSRYLFVTVAAGGALLCVNVGTLVACVYMRRARMRRRTKRGGEQESAEVDELSERPRDESMTVLVAYGLDAAPPAGDGLLSDAPPAAWRSNGCTSTMYTTPAPALHHMYCPMTAAPILTTPT